MNRARLRRPRRGEIVLAVLGAVLCAAPTVGDVGGCGDEPSELDERAFARTRKRVDCTRCRQCAIPTRRCLEACGPEVVPYVAFPSTCRPLLHDGEVCIRALQVASCEDYAGYVDDEAPTAPTECGFCRVATDAGAD